MLFPQTKSSCESLTMYRSLQHVSVYSASLTRYYSLGTSYYTRLVCFHSLHSIIRLLRHQHEHTLDDFFARYKRSSSHHLLASQPVTNVVLRWVLNYVFIIPIDHRPSSSSERVVLIKSNFGRLLCCVNFFEESPVCRMFLLLHSRAKLE